LMPQRSWKKESRHFDTLLPEHLQKTTISISDWPVSLAQFHDEFRKLTVAPAKQDHRWEGFVPGVPPTSGWL